MMNLAAWLKAQGLERLEPLLCRAGIDLDIIADLDDTDLLAMGLNLGDRKRLLKAISALSTAATAIETGRASAALDDKATSAERRQLTVMFCDLVGSTLLSTRLDPEDMRQVIGAYHHAIGAAVAPYDSHIAQLWVTGCWCILATPRRTRTMVNDLCERQSPHRTS